MQYPANELRRIPLPRTPVNNTLVVYLPIRFIADSPLRGIVAHKVWSRGGSVWLSRITGDLSR
jgi:hypothetical protein